MTFAVVRFEDTPNPNAVKCWLDRRISEGPRSFRNAAAASEDPVARALFEEAGATNVLFCDDWVTVNKAPEASWPAVKKRIRAVLAKGRETSVADA